MRLRVNPCRLKHAAVDGPAEMHPPKKSKVVIVTLEAAATAAAP
jgi:hypothetical protein